MACPQGLSAPAGEAASRNTGGAMTFAILPRDYLHMLQEQHAEYSADPLSLRKAIAVSMFANHICEHVFAAYAQNDVQKVDGLTTASAYRLHLENMKPELKLIRDLCDFGKHGPTLSRRTVQVAKTELKETMVPDAMWFALGGFNHRAEDKIVVTLIDGKERFFDYLIDDVVKFWSDHFSARGL
jgi:hypothetical protein